jgi:hypothetical protein
MAVKYGIAAAAVLVSPVGWGAVLVGAGAIAATILVDEGAKYLKKKYEEG